MTKSEPATRKERVSRKSNSGLGMTSDERARLCAKTASEFKAVEVVLLDVTGFASFADYFVIASGKSSRQVQGIAENVERELKDKGLRPMGSEGLREGQWVLLDYGDVIMHLFYEPVRNFYDLESLWSEAKRVRFDEDNASSRTDTD